MEVYVSSLGNHGVILNKNTKDADLDWKHAVPGIIWGRKCMRGKYIYTLLRH